ncbi:uncharacterized protein LOC113100091 [Carassius auratus]|uniref:Uncharacterized protein LOC113100091 n=1 Tax=Carassius auratus TaxID=7957 RepID=A0A6P6PK73_CARAU|nr:uncharacterized protein LOC113100091 [Carassius auratus]
MARAGRTAASSGAETSVAVKISGKAEVSGAAVGNKSARGRMAGGRRGATRAGRTAGPSSATRGRQAARGRGTRAALGISEEDRVRVERLQEERRSQTQEQIWNMDPDDARRLLVRVMDREPGLIFDVLQPAAQGTEIPLQCVPGWCSCSRCREMGTDLENKCCGMMEATCISRLPHMSMLKALNPLQWDSTQDKVHITAALGFQSKGMKQQV